MDFQGDIQKYFNLLLNTMHKIDTEKFNDLIKDILEAYNNNANIYIFGNGGSASTASHFANDFNKGISENLEKKFKFYCLNDNIPTILAVANDLGYEYIFEFQLKNRLKENDIVIGISGSGNSQNIILAIEYAKSVGIKTWALTGYDGGKLAKISDRCLNVPISNMQITEDLHIIFNHAMMSILKNRLQ